MYRYVQNKITRFLNIGNPVSVQIIKYVLSGGAATLVELILLYLFTEFFGIWYIFSLVLAFIVAFLTSFTLQKFWTFKNAIREMIPRQMVLHFVATVTGLFLNIAGLYVLVEQFGLWYMLAQVLVGGAIAIASFFVYKFIIFKKDELAPDTQS